MFSSAVITVHTVYIQKYSIFTITVSRRISTHAGGNFKHDSASCAVVVT